MADIRIIDQQELTSLENDAYVVTDNSSDGTKKYNLKRLDTAIAGVNADLEEAVIAIENGTHDNLTSGSAEQLLSDKYTEDQVPYIFRASGSDGADREYDEIVGGSVVWNQLVNISNLRTRTVGGLTFTNNNDGSVSVVGTATETNAYSMNTYAVSVIAGRKYYVHGVATTSNYGITITSELSSPVGIDGVVISSSQTAININLYVNEGATLNIKVYPQIHDLTQMFGSTIADYIYSLEQSSAGAGVAWFKKLFPNNYYAYDAGTMMHVSGLSSHGMVGFNAWDEEWELGGIDGTTGQNLANADRIRSKNYIPIISSSPYYFCYTGALSNLNVYVCTYDENKNFIKRTSSTWNVTKNFNDNVRFVRFFVYHASGITVYNHDICINISDASRNGQYEPYVKHSYPLDSTLTLRGIPKLDSNNQLYYDGDTYAADGTVTRKYGIVDLGTLSWLKYDVTQGTLFRTTIGDSKRSANDTTSLSNIICSKYVNVGQSSRSNKTISRPEQSWYFDIIDNDYTDVASFKTAMSGVYLVYELATPTTETATPFTNPQVVDPNGTEEYVTTSIVPVGHYTKYPANLRSAIERVMEQVPEAPSANGTYTLKATKTSSGVTYAWTAE